MWQLHSLKSLAGQPCEGDGVPNLFIDDLNRPALCACMHTYGHEEHMDDVLPHTYINVHIQNDFLIRMAD